MFKTHPMSLSDLLRKVDDTDIQLPDFQRGWVWEDDRIRGSWPAFHAASPSAR